ncbi:DUF6414 family protein [Virgibacillus halodenitrificans]|uniref:DUF6414 family protein n=1 Tax=Virgibacillus halodenitrificans TaxID=1482 RepID=UPI000761D9F4
MFKNLVYFDSQKVAEYSALLKGERQVDIKKVRRNTSKSVQGKIPVVSGKYGDTDEVEGEIIDNPIFDCNELEELLEQKGQDNYFDLIENEDYDIETIPKTAIVRFEGDFNIPVQFDMMDLINEFKPMLTAQMDLENEGEEEVFNKVFGKESTKIPVFLGSDKFKNRIGFSKLNSNNLKYQLEELEDFEDEEVTIIAKVLTRKDVKSTPIVVFDVMKDLLSLNRALRRQMEDQEFEGIENIKSDEDVIVFEVLAIYQ